MKGGGQEMLVLVFRELVHRTRVIKGSMLDVERTALACALMFFEDTELQRLLRYSVFGLLSRGTRADSRRKNFYGINAFGIGRSPVDPNCTICVPAVDLAMNHVAFDGRKTVASNLPSPS